MGLAPYPWLERPAEVLSKMLGKLPGGVLIYGPRGCGVFELASRFAAAVVCQHPADGAPCGICTICPGSGWACFPPRFTGWTG